MVANLPSLANRSRKSSTSGDPLMTLHSPNSPSPVAGTNTRNPSSLHGHTLPHSHSHKRNTPASHHHSSLHAHGTKSFGNEEDSAMQTLPAVVVPPPHPRRNPPKRKVVFVDPDDVDAPWWWPAMVLYQWSIVL